MLKTVAADMTAYGGFVWPREGAAESHDWDPKPICGYGLHGALRGEGDGSLFSWDPDAVWLVVEIDEYVDLGGKVKAPRGTVLYAGDRLTATQMIQARYHGAAVIGGTATAGYEGTATAGYRGTATTGHHGTATAGYEGTATAGYGGTATAGYGGTATAGYYGTATAGDGGTATAGDRGTATAGDRGTATAGDGGELRIRWHDGSRYRLAVGYVGENDILPNVPYKVENGALVRA